VQHGGGAGSAHSELWELGRERWTSRTGPYPVYVEAVRMRVGAKVTVCQRHGEPCEEYEARSVSGRVPAEDPA
jgi:hypothetical protein